MTFEEQTAINWLTWASAYASLSQISRIDRFGGRFPRIRSSEGATHTQHSRKPRSSLRRSGDEVQKADVPNGSIDNRVGVDRADSPSDGRNSCRRQPPAACRQSP